MPRRELSCGKNRNELLLWMKLGLSLELYADWTEPHRWMQLQPYSMRSWIRYLEDNHRLPTLHANTRFRLVSPSHDPDAQQT